MPERCTVIKLDVETLAEAAQDAALAALLADGWSPLAHMIVVVNDKPILHIVLAPPRVGATEVPGWRYTAALVAGLVFAWGVTGAILWVS